MVNPNVIYVLPSEPIDENEAINLSQEILPHSPDIRIGFSEKILLNPVP